MMSMPTSAIAATAAGLISDCRFGSARPDDRPVAGEVAEPAGGHLGTAGVVDAQEQHAGSRGGEPAFDPGEGPEPFPGEPLGEHGR